MVDINVTLVSVMVASISCLVITSTRDYSRKHSTDRRMASALASAIRDQLT